MRLLTLTVFLTSMLFIRYFNGLTNDNHLAATQQNVIVDSFQYTLKSAHPKAKALMTEDFYWNPIEETAPFGSDDGSDAAYGFRQWRLTNKMTSPVTYLKDLISRWQYPYFDYNEMDATKIKGYINRKIELSEADIKEKIKVLKDLNKDLPDAYINKLDDKKLGKFVSSSSKGSFDMYLLGQDNAIIGIGFAQFVIEGLIDNDIKAITITAIKRQLLPLFINRYDDNYRDKRKQQLSKMLGVINNTSS